MNWLESGGLALWRYENSARTSIAIKMTARQISVLPRRVRTWSGAETLFKGPQIIDVNSAWKPSTEFQSRRLFCEGSINDDELPENRKWMEKNVPVITWMFLLLGDKRSIKEVGGGVGTLLPDQPHIIKTYCVVRGRRCAVSSLRETCCNCVNCMWRVSIAKANWSHCLVIQKSGGLLKTNRELTVCANLRSFRDFALLFRRRGRERQLPSRERIVDDSRLPLPKITRWRIPPATYARLCRHELFF